MFCECSRTRFIPHQLPTEEESSSWSSKSSNLPTNTYTSSFLPTESARWISHTLLRHCIYLSLVVAINVCTAELDVRESVWIEREFKFAQLELVLPAAEHYTLTLYTFTEFCIEYRKKNQHHHFHLSLSSWGNTLTLTLGSSESQKKKKRREREWWSFSWVKTNKRETWIDCKNN